MLHFTLNSLIIDEIELYRKYRKKVSKYILLGKNVGRYFFQRIIECRPSTERV